MSLFIKHTPWHLQITKEFYFITSRTVGKIDFFDSDQEKSLLKNCLREALNKYQVSIYAWIILANHYHLLVKFNNPLLLPDFIGYINGKSAHLLLHGVSRLRRDQVTAEPLHSTDKNYRHKIWWNYWDKCLWNEKDFWQHFNYIHHNPIKHGYVKNFLELANYPFSSYQHYLKKYGQEWLDSCFESYPIRDFSVNE